MQYQYSAKSTSGATLTGLATGASLQDVQRQLREKGLFVLSAQPAERAGRAGAAPAVRRGRRRRVSKRDLVTLTSQLAIMTQAGVDFATALGNLAGQTPQPVLREVLERVHADVLEGKPVSQALAPHEAIFGRSYIAGIAAAEASGRLPEVLNRLASLLRGELRLRGTVRGLLTYPLVLASVSLIVVGGLVFFVLPQFAAMFRQMDLTLPVVTQLLISVSTALRTHWWLWGGLALGTIGGGIAMLRSPRGLAWVHYGLLHLAMIRDVTRSLAIGRALRLLSTMLGSGVPLLEGLRLTRASVGNIVLREFFQQLEQEVINGRGLAACFLSAPFIPPAAAQMIATAEHTGRLAPVMELVGEFYEEEGGTRLRELATMMEPIIIIVMGLVVATVVMSVMLPIFDFATAAH